MNSAVILARARVPWAQKVRDSDHCQRPSAAEEQSASFFEPKRVQYTAEGAEEPRREVWFIHQYQPDGWLKRTRVVASIEVQLLLQLPHRFEFEPVNVRQLLCQPKFKGWTVGRMLLRYEQLSRDTLRDGFERFDEMLENRRPRRYVVPATTAEADVPRLASETPALEAFLEEDDATAQEYREPTQPLGVKATSRPHAQNVLRGRFIRCTPYRGEDVGRTIDPMEQWIAVVDTDQGQFHLVDIDLKRAFEVSGAQENDAIRIIKRDPQTAKVQVNITEERHGVHGEGTHTSPLTRAEVYDVYIEKKFETYSDGRRRQKNVRSKADTAVGTGPLPEALRDIKPEGEVMREVLRHINERSVTGWTRITVEGQPKVHLRLLSCSPEDHLALIVKADECVGRYVYPESLESVRRRVLLRLPDLVIQPT